MAENSVEAESKVRTVELTHKKFKKMILASMAMITTSLALIFGTDITASEDFGWGDILTGALLYGGIILYVYAKFMAWWHNG